MTDGQEKIYVYTHIRYACMRIFFEKDEYDAHVIILKMMKEEENFSFTNEQMHVNK